MKATERAKGEEVKLFMEKEIMKPFGVQRVVVSHKGSCFTLRPLAESMKSHGTEWHIVLAYAPMSNVRAERTVGTVK